MRVIQMGIGGMGQAWLERVRPLDFVDYVGYVEINPEIAKTQAKKFKLDGKTIFSTLEEATTAIEADAVIAVIPPEFRTETLKICIDKGLALLAEKPLADSMDDALMQLDLTNQSGITYAIAQNYRYRLPIQTLKDILDSGEMGRIDAVTVSHYKGIEFTGFRAEMPYPLLNDMSIHHFDLMRFLLGNNPQTIYARTWHPSWSVTKGKMAAFAMLEFPDDLQVAYNASWSSTGQASSWNGDWRFDCEKGVLVLRDDCVYVQMRSSEPFEKMYEYNELETRDLVKRPYEDQAYLAHELHESIANNRLPATSIQDNIFSLQMVFDAIESSNSGQIIQFQR